MADSKISNATEEIQRGREAAHIVGHPMVTGALDAIESKYLEQWMSSDIEDVKSREFAYRMFRSSQLFRILLTKTIESGIFSAEQVALEERQQASLED